MALAGFLCYSLQVALDKRLGEHESGLRILQKWNIKQTFYS